MNKKNMRFCAGGLLLLLAVIFGMPVLDPVASFFQGMVTTVLYQTLSATATGIALLFTRSIYMVSVFILGILLMAKVNPKLRSIYLCVIGGSCMIATLFFTALAVIIAGQYIFSFPSLFYSLSVAALALVSLGCHIDGLKFAKNLWFVPGIVLILAYIAQTINIAKYNYDAITFIATVAMSLIPEILSVVGFFLAAKWMTNPMRKQIAVPYQAPQQPSYQPPQYR